jgi:hypothetical protein
MEAMNLDSSQGDGRQTRSRRRTGQESWRAFLSDQEPRARGRTVGAEGMCERTRNYRESDVMPCAPRMLESIKMQTTTTPGRPSGM